MPEAAVLKPVPSNPEVVDTKSKPLTAKVEYVDDRLPKMQKAVDTSLKEAGVSELTRRPAPHIPNFEDTGAANKEIEEASDSEPDSFKRFKLKGLPNIVEQHLTGDTTVVGDAKGLHETKQAMADNKLSFQNQPKKEPKNIFDWFYDEKKKAV